MVDMYSDTVTGQYVPYILPQEHGNHTDVRWVSLANGKTRVRFPAEGPMEFSASHFTAEDLFAATHTHQLAPRAETILNLDFRQRGLGTASCGPDTLDPYRISGRDIRLDLLDRLRETMMRQRIVAKPEPGPRDAVF